MDHKRDHDPELPPLWPHDPMHPWIVVGLLFLTSSCAPLTHFSGSSRCSELPPADAAAVTRDRIDSLAGRFELVEIISSWPDRASRVTELELHRPDTALVQRLLAERGVRGPKDLRLIGSERWSKKYRPEPAELDAGTLYIGCLGNCMDGQIEYLRLTAISSRGFWGTWSEDQGLIRNIGKDGKTLPQPAGYFCAIRK